MLPRRNTVPLPVKIAYTLFVCVLVPVYWRHYGAANFLWLCDVALLATLIALWAENRLLTGMMAVGTLPLELGWLLDFVAGGRLFGGADYMFDPAIPIWVRGLSLFHVALPLLLVWLVRRFGYDRRALLRQTALSWIVLAASYALTDPSDNVNWVFGPGSAQTAMAPLLYLACLMAGLALLVFAPTHLVLGRLYGERGGGDDRRPRT